MNTCERCKWWGREYPGACDFVDTLHATKDEASMFTIKAWALDDSGLETRLITGPQFSCIKFEGTP